MPRGELAVLTPEPGTVVGEKYRILRLLGEGGMGTVYEAENTLTLKRAAIKWLHPRLIAVEEAGKRLLHEARAMARIRHQNVIDIYDVVIEQNSVFLVMELLIGEELSQLLAREQLTAHELVALLLPAMRGVAAAHAAGVVHRDIKPDNIFLVHEPGAASPLPKVIDFGISRFFEADAGRLTRSGMTMGTPRYVSYEQLRGARDVDQRADIYAFGVILYECLVGQAPYDASTFGEQAISFVTTEPPAPRALRPELPEGLDALIRAATAKERNLRPASMEALIAALEPFAQPQAYTTPLRTYAPRPARGYSEEIYPDQTTGPATRTPLPGAVSSRSSREAAASLPSPKTERRPLRRGPRVVAASLLAVLALGLIWLTRNAGHDGGLAPGQQSSIGAAHADTQRAPAAPTAEPAPVGPAPLPEAAPEAAAPRGDVPSEPARPPVAFLRSRAEPRAATEAEHGVLPRRARPRSQAADGGASAVARPSAEAASAPEKQAPSAGEPAAEKPTDPAALESGDFPHRAGRMLKREF